MSAGATVMMLIGMLILWGGLALSIWHAVRSSRKQKA